MKSLAERAEEIASDNFVSSRQQVDLVMTVLLAIEWVVLALIAVRVAPLAWAGKGAFNSAHALGSVALGALAIAFPIFLGITRRGELITRSAFAVGQMVMGILFIHLSGGRIETHFHIFASLAVLSAYRDWRVIAVGTTVTVLDHALRGWFYPVSVYGLDQVAWYRFVEHGAWVGITCTVLVIMGNGAVTRVRAAARTQAELEEFQEKALEQTSLRLQDTESQVIAVAEAAPVGIATTDTEGTILFHNGKWMEITSEFGNGIGWNALLPSDLLGALEADWFNAPEPPVLYECPLALHTMCGKLKWLFLSARALQRPGQPVHGYVVVLIDQTELRTRELSLEQQAEELRIARDAALESTRLKGEFIKNVTHEIRTPMNGVIACAELLLASDLRPELRELVETIDHSTEKLMTMIDEILNFSRLENEEISLVAREFDPGELESHVIATFGPVAQEAGLCLLLSSTSTGNVRAVKGDLSKICQVVDHLVSNACKFCPEGSVQLVMSIQEVQGEARLTVSVSDDGPGIDPKMVGAIFDSFRQGDGSLTRKHGGVGIGLAIAKRLSALMGGSLSVVNREQGGACFTLDIPVEVAAYKLAVDVPSGKARVLVIDDNDVNRKVAQRMLVRMNCSVELAENGKLGVEAIGNGTFDLVLMDIQMPVMDGLEATRTVRAQEVGTGRHQRIVALTAHAMDDERQRCLEAGMDGFLTKPLRMEDLKLLLSQDLESEAA